MFVNTELLHSGAGESHRAATHARDAADHLSRGPLLSGMFGCFAAAEAFHDALTVAHAKHVKTLQAHQETLTAIGGRAQRAAAGIHRHGAAQRRKIAGAAMQQLRHISIAQLIAEAGGNPWTINTSLQSGGPAQISDLAQAFRDASGTPPSPAPYSMKRSPL